MSTPKLWKSSFGVSLGLRVNGYQLVGIVHTLCGFWFLKHIVATGRQCCLVTVCSVKTLGGLEDLAWICREFRWVQRCAFISASSLNLLEVPSLLDVSCVLAYIMCAGINYVKSAWLVCIKLVWLERVSTFLTCKMGSLALAILKLHWKKKHRWWDFQIIR